jgi:hypothetical protein
VARIVIGFAVTWPSSHLVVESITLFIMNRPFPLGVSSIASTSILLGLAEVAIALYHRSPSDVHCKVLTSAASHLPMLHPRSLLPVKIRHWLSRISFWGDVPCRINTTMRYSSCMQWVGRETSWDKSIPESAINVIASAIQARVIVSSTFAVPGFHGPGSLPASSSGVSNADRINRPVMDPPSMCDTILSSLESLCNVYRSRIPAPNDSAGAWMSAVGMTNIYVSG